MDALIKIHSFITFLHASKKKKEAESYHSFTGRQRSVASVELKREPELQGEVSDDKRKGHDCVREVIALKLYHYGRVM